MTFTELFLQQAVKLIDQIDRSQIDDVAALLAGVREHKGRLFIVGSGGGAGHASHATCDFRKICKLETYAPYDNVSELTARVNDDGWDSTLANWLAVSNLRQWDALMVMSVGGGDEVHNISMNLVNAVKYSKLVGAKVVGIVGKSGGYTKQVGDAVIVVPTVDENLLTPLTEGFQAVLWHLLVSHPLLQINSAKWESVAVAGKRA